MNKPALANYHGRMQRVLAHIDQNLGGDLGLDALSSVAAFSKHHFQRQFSATFGIAPHRYVQLARLKRASFRLAFRAGDSITDIALDAGFEAPETFSRSFKQCFGQTPTAFRHEPAWEPWLTTLGPLKKARTMHMHPDFTATDVRIINAAAIPIAHIEHRGAMDRVGTTIQRFIAWRRAAGLHPRNSATYNIFHTDPENTPDDLAHLDICVATHRDVPTSDIGITSGQIPAGRCAVLRITGASAVFEAAAAWLYREWLPQSGEEPRDFPFYCQRIEFFPDVPEHKAVTDLFLPLL